MSLRKFHLRAEYSAYGERASGGARTPAGRAGFQGDAVASPFSSIEAGLIEGYASVFNQLDGYGTLFRPGAFRRSLSRSKGKVKVLWQHQADQPIGRLVEVMEDHYGLQVCFQLIPGVRAAEECYQLIRHGAIDGLSIGFTVEEERLSAEGVEILEATLYEISPVTFPANPKAQIDNFRDGQRPPSDSERFLLERLERDLTLQIVHDQISLALKKLECQSLKPLSRK